MLATNSTARNGHSRDVPGSHHALQLLAMWRHAWFLLNLPVNISLLVLAIRHLPLPVSDLSTAGRILVIYCVMCTAAVFLHRRMELLSFPVMILCATLAYTCSSFALLVYRGLEVFNLWFAFDEQSVLIGMPIVMLAFSSFASGAFLVPSRHHAADGSAGSLADTLHQASTRSRALLRVGQFLFWSSIIVLGTLTLRDSGLAPAITGGYKAFTDLRKLGQRDILTTAILSYGIPWSIIIIASAIRGRNALSRLFVLAGIGVAVMVIAGDRTGPLSVLLVVPSVLRLRGLRMNRQLAVTTAAVVLILLAVVPKVRKVPVKEWSLRTFVNAFTGRLEVPSRLAGYGFVDSALVSTSSSYQTLMGTVMLVPSEEPYRYGRDYAAALAAGFPFSSRAIDSIAPHLLEEKPSSWITENLNPSTRATRTGLAYLQVAEAYLQFGAVGVALVFFLLGLFMSRLWLLMLSRKVGASAFCFGALLAQGCLIWVRNDAYLMGRILVWCGFLVFLAPALLHRAGSIRTLGIRHHE